VIYDWRPNDHSPALSRNRGAEMASAKQLVFLDSDILLNPLALASYRAYLEGKPDALLYGYMGSDLDRQAPSAFFPERQVNFLDKRYDWDGRNLKAKTMIFHSAYECAYSGNFALLKDSYQSIGGFDERFKGWGGEDLDFAERAVKQGYEAHFLIDAWGEHQVHSRQESFHERPSESRAHFYTFRPHPTMPYRVRSLSQAHILADLEQKLKRVY